MSSTHGRSGAPRRADARVIGVVTIIGATFLMSLQDALIKLTNADMPLWQIFVLRSAVATPVLWLIARRRGIRLAGLANPDIGWIALRALLLTAMYVALYASAPWLSLATLAAGFYMGPLFIVALSAILGGDRFSIRHAAAAAIGFGGVLLALRPDAEAFTVIALAPILSAMLYALAAVLTRQRLREVDPLALGLGLSLMLFIVGALASFAIALGLAEPAGGHPFLFSGWRPMGASEVLLVVGLAVLLVGIAIGLAAAYQLAPASLIASFDYSYLIFAVLWDAALFHQTPALATLIGLSLIAGAGGLALKSGEPRETAPPRPPRSGPAAAQAAMAR